MSRMYLEGRKIKIEEKSKKGKYARLYILEKDWIFDEPYSHHCTIFKVVEIPVSASDSCQTLEY